MIEETLLEAEEKMEKALVAAKNELASIRTGRANPALFTSLSVEYYGAPPPLQQLASVPVPEAGTVLITPCDRPATKDIVTAVRESDLGVNPTDDGNVIRVNLPALTEERRKEYVKLARARAEESRVQLRNVRRKTKDVLDKIKKDGEAGEDEVERAEKELDALTKRYVEQVDKALAAKESELLEV